MTNLFFDDNGSFKAGSVLSSTSATYQVELSTGKRTKVKGSKVFFSFEQPSPQAFMEKAQAQAAELDPSFLWEVAPKDEFSYEDLAAEYFGDEETNIAKAGLLMKLYESPVYFYRKGRGRFKAAPEEILKRALEALERKRKQEEHKKAITAELVAGTVPPEISADPIGLLIHADKNSIEWKALSDAAAERRMTPLKLLLELKAIASPWHWHVDSFYAENFPEGAGFPDTLPQPPEGRGDDLPVSDAVPFSIDDSSTTEIDDATSVTHMEGGKTRIGIHIAVPSIGMQRGDPMISSSGTVCRPSTRRVLRPRCSLKTG